ncbi:MAG: hypothetical protein ACO3IJ_12775, partial [Steroidobacteraceae bacterium]
MDRDLGDLHPATSPCSRTVLPSRTFCVPCTITRSPDTSPEIGERRVARTGIRPERFQVRNAAHAARAQGVEGAARGARVAERGHA